jgi:hypothetical protein
MAGRKPEGQEVNIEWFKWVLAKVGRSIRSLGKERGGTEYNERTIRRCLEPNKDNPETGRMSPGLIDAVAREIDVDPEYLAGKYVWTLRLPVMDEADCREYWKEHHLHPKWFPYMHHEQDELGIYRYLRDTLLVHGISQEAYEMLSRQERQSLQRDLDHVTTRVLRHYLHEGEYIETIEYRQVMDWQSEADVIDTLFSHLEDLGLIEVESCDPGDVPDYYEENIKSATVVE